MEGIVLNRMYAGNYLMSNLGHEVINMFQDDNGRHYLYLNPTGDFIKAHQGRIGFMLLVKYAQEGIVEVLGLAKGLHDVFDANKKTARHYNGDPDLASSQKQYIEREGGISYGGVSILDLFIGSEQENVFITYKADRVYIPKDERVFICFKGAKVPSTKEGLYFQLNGYKQAKTSLKQYILPDGAVSGEARTADCTDRKQDYSFLLDHVIRNESLWSPLKNRIDKSDLKKPGRVPPVSIFDICRIQDSENCFSNALCHFMMRKEYRKLWHDFFQQFGIALDEEYYVTREEDAKIDDTTPEYSGLDSGGRIDLLIRDSSNLVLIENKIKSDINRVSIDGEDKQLGRYWNYIKWLSNVKEPQRINVHALILKPLYGNLDVSDKMKDVYKIITYRDLYVFLKKRAAEFQEDINFIYFIDAIKRHTYDNERDYLYQDMQRNFYQRILSLSSNEY